MAYDITLIPGDGTGPELAEATRRCIDATGVKFHWDVQPCGIEVIEAQGKIPDSVFHSIRTNKVALKAPITTPIGKGFRSVNVALRQELGLYACVRPCKTYKGVRSYFDKTNVDLVIVRENTEDLYAGVEFKAGEPKTAELIQFINANELSTIRRYLSRSRVGSGYRCPHRAAEAAFRNVGVVGLS